VIVAPAVARFIVRVRKIGYGAACARNGSEQHRDERLAGLFFLITCEEEEEGGGAVTESHTRQTRPAAAADMRR
jgi:hypothetical protein